MAGHEERYGHSSEPKTSDYLLKNGERFESPVTVTEWERLQMETEVAGLTILFELNQVFGD